MPSASTELRLAVISLIEEEFADVEWVGGVRPGKLYRALGEKGHYAGVSPVDVSPTDRNMAVQRPTVLVQLWHRFDKKIQLENIVDPTVVEGWAERLQNAVREASTTDSKNWYMNVRRIEFPDDPLGQKTRVLATIDADGPNVAIHETSA